jgi:hypothetical protein
LLIGALVACSRGSPLALDQVPVYPAAVELRAAKEVTENAALDRIMAQDASYRQQNGTSNDLTNKRLRLPPGFDAVGIMGFYSSSMTEQGWTHVPGAVPARHAYANGSQVLVIHIVTNPNGERADLLMTLDEP